MIQGFVFALLAALGFSLKAIFVKLAYPHGVDAVTLLALRMLLSLPVFLAVAWWVSRGAHVPRLERRDWVQIAVLGCLGYYGASILDFLGLLYISAGLERLILFIYPTLIILVGVLFQGKKVSRAQIGALTLCYVGIGLAFVHDLRLSNPADVFKGSLLVFGSAICFAIYMAGSAPVIQRLGSLRFTALAMLVSTAATMLHFALMPGLAWSRLITQPAPVYGWALAMALIATVLPVFAQSAAIKLLGASITAIFAMIGPILTIAMGAWLLQEPVSALQLSGAGLVILGIALITRASLKSAVAARR